MRACAATLSFCLFFGCSGGSSGDVSSDSGAPSGDATSDVGADAGSDADAGPPKPPLLFGVVEEQHALCFQGEAYPCARVVDDETRRKAIAAAAPGLLVRWGGYETERSGLGMTGNAQRRNLLDNVGYGPSFDDQLEPSWLIARAKLAGYASWILAVPVTQSNAGAFTTGAHEWNDVDARANLDAWKAAIDASGWPPPSFIELGNEPWNYASGSDGYKANAAGYVTKARLVGAAVKQKILDFGWKTRIAVVIDNWPGGDFESGGSDKYPPPTIALAAELAVNGPPVVQTHAYPLHGGYWCPKPITTGSDVSDVACVYALYVMLQKIKAAAPSADLIVTEDNYDSNAYPRAGVYTTLAALLTFAAGGVAYTHFGNNDYGAKGDRYELFLGLTPVPLFSNEIVELHQTLAGMHQGDVAVTSSGTITIGAAGYPLLVGSKSAPARYAFRVGLKEVDISIPDLSITWH